MLGLGQIEHSIRYSHTACMIRAPTRLKKESKLPKGKLVTPVGQRAVDMARMSSTELRRRNHNVC
jgi:hypothetical protein